MTSSFLGLSRRAEPSYRMTKLKLPPYEASLLPRYFWGATKYKSSPEKSVNSIELNPVSCMCFTGNARSSLTFAICQPSSLLSKLERILLYTKLLPSQLTAWPLQKHWTHDCLFLGLVRLYWPALHLGTTMASRN